MQCNVLGSWKVVFVGGAAGGIWINVIPVLYMYQFKYINQSHLIFHLDV